MPKYEIRLLFPVQKFGVSKTLVRIFDVFEKSLLWSPRLHLLDEKYSKNSKNIITILNNTFLI